MKTEIKKGHLIIAFEILDENGKSILPKDYINGSKKSIEIDSLNIIDVSQVRHQVEVLVRKLAEFLSPNEQHPKLQDINLKELGEKEYIDALHALMIPRVQCQITEMENSLNGLPPKSKSLKELRDKCGKWCLSNYKNPHSSDH
jgi:hypothetical protein